MNIPDAVMRQAVNVALAKAYESDDLALSAVSEAVMAEIARDALEAAAPLLMAQAWDEGQKSGLRYADRIRAAMEIGRLDLPGTPSANPYRP